MPEDQQYTGGLLGALAASGALMEASRGQPGGGRPSWGQGLGAAMRAGAGTMQGYQQHALAGQAAQQALQLRGALDQTNARRQLAGMQPLTPADIARNPWAANGQAVPAAGGPPAADAGAGGMAGGGVFPSREQAMRQASLWGLAGDPAMAKMMQDYGMGGLDKFELNQDGSMRPISGGPQDLGTIRNKAAAEKMMVQGPNGSYAFAPGVVQSEAGLSGAKAGADAGARLPFAIKEAGAKASIDL
ncbi:MAG: hypothetical protein K2Q10_11150, partial [Rhodospirillales bacterium]|nr:hypothetical protein [Rhodospirillales bacterium]